MADTAPTCPKTRAVYEKLRPVMEKLPEELAQKITKTANELCVAEGSVATLGSIVHWAARSGRIR